VRKALQLSLNVPAIALLDRGWSRPSQELTGPNGEPVALSIHIDLGGSG